MLDKLIRFIVLAVLVGIAVVAAFFILGLLLRLLVIGAIVIAIVIVIASFRGKKE